MRKANRSTAAMIGKRLREVRMSEHDRQRAMHAIRDAEAIVDAVMWVRDRIAALSASLLKPVLKH